MSQTTRTFLITIGWIFYFPAMLFLYVIKAVYFKADNMNKTYKVPVSRPSSKFHKITCPENEIASVKRLLEERDLKIEKDFYFKLSFWRNKVYLTLDKPHLDVLNDPKIKEVLKI